MYIYYHFERKPDGTDGGAIEISCSAGSGLIPKFRSFSTLMVPGTVDPMSDWHYREDIFGFVK